MQVQHRGFTLAVDKLAMAMSEAGFPPSAIAKDDQRNGRRVLHYDMLTPFPPRALWLKAATLSGVGDIAEKALGEAS